MNVTKAAELGKTPLYSIFALKNRRPETWGDRVQVDVDQTARIVVDLVPAAIHQQEEHKVIEAEVVED